VAFFSKSLNVYERNYKIYDKELLAVIQKLEKYRHYLKRHLHKIEIWSDHQNLTFFRTAQKLTRRQERWALFITCFDFVLYHKLGKMMQAEDPLSRQTDHEMEINLDNMNQVLLKPEFFAINVLEATHKLPINDEIILKEIKAALLLDKVTKNYKSLLKSGLREFKKSLQNWNYENRLLLYKGKIYIPHSMEDTL